MTRQQFVLSLSAVTAVYLFAAPSRSEESEDAESKEERPPAERILNASPYSIRADAELREFVRATAEAATVEHCARCHGPDLKGGQGVANLVDDEWLWGVTGEEMSEVEPVAAIQQTILYGVRNVDCPEIREQSRYRGCADTRYSEMPAYSELGLDKARIADLVEYTLALSGDDADDDAAARAAKDYQIFCGECHDEEGYGYKLFGGPSLRDEVSLYGNDRPTVTDVITNGRLGACPPWEDKLDAATIKAIAVHIWERAHDN